MILPGDLPPRVRRELAEVFTETARTLSASGMRLVLPESIYTGQTAWPEDSPLSEPELRAEVQAIVNDAKVLEERTGELRERARELYERLPRTALAEGEFGLPQSIYYALTDALACVIDDGLDELSYLERKLADTPESLRADWLWYHVEGSGDLCVEAQWRDGDGWCSRAPRHIMGRRRGCDARSSAGASRRSGVRRRSRGRWRWSKVRVISECLSLTGPARSR